ncbi:MAG: hypothetical protein PVJ67_05955 [Candidatus Pacearchaeota archaeon]|jgi:adenylate kinase family enzyme
MKDKRILIFGRAGTGKNWFGEKLSEKLKIKFYDMDDFSWKKRFTVRYSKTEILKNAQSAVRKEKWIIGGWTAAYADLAKEKADLIIILKANFLVTTYRIIRRNIKHKGKEESPYNSFQLAWQNFLVYFWKDEQKARFEDIIRKYPKKVLILNQKEKREFLEAVK